MLRIDMHLINKKINKHASLWKEESFEENRDFYYD